MANCQICDKKLGFLDTVSLELKASGTTFARIEVCEDCKAKMYKLKEGDHDAYKEIHAVTDASDDKDLKYFVTAWETVPEDIKAELEQKAAAEKAEKAAAEKAFAEKMDALLLTTGCCVEGCKIEKYLGVVSGEAVLGTGFLAELDASVTDFHGEVSPELTEKLVKAKDFALVELKKKSAALGANAVISIDFDYITFTRNMVGVVANGTAVLLA